MTTELFTNTGGISRDAADRAVQWLVDNAEEIARRKAMMVYHEDRLRVVKSTAMALSDEKSIAAKEAEAYAAEMEARLAKAMQVVEMIASSDVDAVLGEAVDLSCEIIGDLMDDEDNG